MADLDSLVLAAGIDPKSDDHQLRAMLAEADDELLEQLVALRKTKGMRQKDVAERMRRDKSAVSIFEQLGSDPHLSTIRRYAAAIGAIVTHSVGDFELMDDTKTNVRWQSATARHFGHEAPKRRVVERHQSSRSTTIEIKVSL